MTSASKQPLRVCYVGISRSNFSRNRVFSQGLRQNGVQIIECFDTAPGLKKFVNLFKKLRQLRGSYDVIIIAYPGHIIVPFIRFITTKPIIFDAFSSLYEGEIISRQRYPRFSFGAFQIWLIDFLANQMATRILVETDHQKAFFQKMFLVSSKKCIRVFTGVDDALFYPDPAGKKKNTFTVLFRGKFLPEAGVTHVIKAAHILQKEPIDFIIMGFGFLEQEVRAELERAHVPRVMLLTQEFEEQELRAYMVECHVSLGQLEDHERLARTIPHKAFESIAMKIPYLTARTAGIQELLEDGKSCLMVNPGDAQDLAEKILYLKNNPEVADRIAEEAYSIYMDKARPIVLGREIIAIAQSLL